MNRNSIGKKNRVLQNLSLWSSHSNFLEANAILKTAGSNHNCNGATLYLTMSPCKDCSKLILQSGIIRVVYLEEYKDNSGVQFLKEAGVKIIKFNIEKL